jgi:hypothetical protein
MNIDYADHLQERLGLAYQFASMTPLIGTRPEWMYQENTFLAGASDCVLFTFRPSSYFYLKGVWVTCAQFRDLFSIRPEIRLAGAKISNPQDASTFAPMGDGVNALHLVERVVERDQTLQIVAPTMTFFTGQTSKTFLSIVRGWFL